MKICAVIVTYNRIDKLRKTLQAFDELTEYPDKVYVVDNHSSDDTPEYLKQWANETEKFKKEILTLSDNLGGSGGFYAGLEKALNDSFEWIWVSDDDAYPEMNSFRYLIEYINKSKTDNISAICGTVLYEGGIDYYHRRNLYHKGLTICDVPSDEHDYEKETFDINVFSYVGTVINSKALKKVGYTLKDYFIWCDDTEHSLRLSKVGRIVCVPRIKVFHDIGTNADYGLTWKEYYGERNRLDMYRRHFPFYVYLFSLIKSRIRIVKKLLSGQKESAKLLRCAISDSANSRFGIHAIYKPGWKPDVK